MTINRSASGGLVVPKSIPVDYAATSPTALSLNLNLSATRLIFFDWFCINQPYSQQNKART